MERAQFFSDTEAEAAFDEAFHDLIGQWQRDAMSRFMNEENMSGYSHGNKWLMLEGDNTEGNVGEFKSAQVEEALSFSRIANHEVSALFEFANTIAQRFQSHMMGSMYELIDNTPGIATVSR